VAEAELLAGRLRALPRKLKQHLTLVLEAAYKAGGCPVDAEVVESVLSKTDK